MKKIGNATLYCADCKDVLPLLKDIDSCVTDPPYGLSFMGKAWDYDVPGTDIWTQVHDVLKPGAHLLSFFGSRTYHRGAIPIEDAGFEIRDQLMWLYGSGFPKSHNIGKKVKEYEGWGTALKPAHEPIVMARKPFKGTVAENVLEHGTSGINIDECRVGDEQRTYKGMSANKPQGAGTFRDDNWQPKDIEVTATGRFPANVMHDGSEEVQEIFPQTKSGAIKPYLNKNTDSYSGNFPKHRDYSKEVCEGSASRYFYCAKSSKKDRDEGLDDFSVKQTTGGGGLTSPKDENGNYIVSGNKGTAGKYGSAKAPAKNNHPTVKPTELMRYLCRLVTPKGGVIVDPFMGSGSTGKAAIAEGFGFVGIELNEDYFEIACARIEAAFKSRSQELF
jgi:DNA modification methylase